MILINGEKFWQELENIFSTEELSLKEAQLLERIQQMIKNKDEDFREEEKCPVCNGEGQVRRPCNMMSCLACKGTGKVKELLGGKDET